MGHRSSRQANPDGANHESNNQMISSRKVLAIGLAAGVLVVGCGSASEPADSSAKTGSAPSTVVGRWNLLTLDHRSLPVEVYRSPTGESVYAVEGHLILEADGTHRRWTVTQGAGRRDSVILVGSYVFQTVPAPTIALRIDSNNQGVGVLSAGTLSISYTDFLDWWDESWVRPP
jgi:hypothetical protein